MIFCQHLLSFVLCEFLANDWLILCFKEYAKRFSESVIAMIDAEAETKNICLHIQNEYIPCRSTLKSYIIESGTAADSTRHSMSCAKSSRESCSDNSNVAV